MSEYARFYIISGLEGASIDNPKIIRRHEVAKYEARGIRCESESSYNAIYFDSSSDMSVDGQIIMNRIINEKYAE